MIATSQTREKFPLSKRKIAKKSIKNIFGYFIFALIISISLMIIKVFIRNDSAIDPNVSKVIESGLLLWVNLFIYGVGLFISVLIVLYQYWYFAVYYYELEPDFIVIRKHPITPKEITIPYERIQDVYVDQDIWDRMFGIYDVHLSSATISSGMEAHIDGVNKSAADGLRAELLKTVSEKIQKQKSTAISQAPNSQ